MESSWKTEIFANDPIYHPGDLVTGNVYLTLKRKVQIDSLVATLRGLVNVEFKHPATEKPGFRYRSCSITESSTHRNKKEFLNMSTTIWSQDKAVKETIRRASRTSRTSNDANDFSCPWGLEEGTHHFDFSFKLPIDGLYTSFDSVESSANVRYLLEISSFRGTSEIKRGEVLIAVVCPHLLVIDPLLRSKSQVFIQSKQIPKSGNLSVQLNLSTTSFVPMDAVQGEITIQNYTKQSVKYANFNIEHRITSFSSPPFPESISDAISTLSMSLPADKIPSGNTLNFPISFNIPALVPALNVPHMIASEYVLCLKVGFARNSPNAAVIFMEIPIQIGTEIMEVNNYDIPSAPPAYDEISFQSELTDTSTMNEMTLTNDLSAGSRFKIV
ncbi:hypothetical protein M3Y98_00635000 [Aphelenchoides besseyi]|nr:hypothetical protein M3Y98_00635000 [Aphelenchoides besseyi]KAI6208512.1 hypothetical protein M3Y96_00123200 [Aphelenchoides besseyi]